MNSLLIYVIYTSDDYRGHTSCISEAERYEKSIYKGPKKNDISNRKLTPQETWMSIISESLKSCPPSLTSYIETITSFENVPRKEKPFRNFASNSLKLYGHDGEAIITSLWKHFSAVRQKQTEKKEESKKSQSCEENNKKSHSVDEEEKNSQKSLSVNDEGKNSSKSLGKSGSIPDKKAVSKAIKKALKTAPKHELEFKKLRKMVKADESFQSNSMGKVEWKKIIKESIMSKKSLKLDGKMVTLIS